MALVNADGTETCRRHVSTSILYDKDPVRIYPTSFRLFSTGFILLALVCGPGTDANSQTPDGDGSIQITGEFQRWHPITLTLDGTVNFSGTNYVRDWQVHVPDWDQGDPTWAGGTAGAAKGKGLIGTVNYIAEKGINQQYFITMNIQGDGRAAYPYMPEAASNGSYDVFDVSKLDQWQIVFHHMIEKGVIVHVLLQEIENELLFENGSTAIRTMRCGSCTTVNSSHVSWASGADLESR